MSYGEYMNENRNVDLNENTNDRHPQFSHYSSNAGRDHCDTKRKQKKAAISVSYQSCDTIVNCTAVEEKYLANSFKNDQSVETHNSDMSHSCEMFPPSPCDPSTIECIQKSDPIDLFSDERSSAVARWAASSAMVMSSEMTSCSVCGDIVAGFHCGAYVCEACKVWHVLISESLFCCIIHGTINAF